MKFSGKTIQFSPELSPDDLKSNWNIGETYDIEFFEGEFTPVHLIDANSDLTEYIQQISLDQLIFFDIKCVQFYTLTHVLNSSEREQIPPVCLFTFCCSSGVYIFKQLTLSPNEQLKEFLSTKSSRRLIGFNLESVVKKTNQFFGKDFSFTFEDIGSFSPKFQSLSIYELAVKFFKNPQAEFTSKEIKKALWYKNLISMQLVVYAAFKVVTLSKCYSNIPLKTAQQPKQNANPEPEKKEIENSPPKVIYNAISPSEVNPQPMDNYKGEIHFYSESDFGFYQDERWYTDNSYDVEFFPGVMTTVTLRDAACDISQYVNIMKKDPVIFVDFEYVMPYKPAPPICLFQFCCSRGAYLFKQARMEYNIQMRDFLSIKSGNKFVAKGAAGDLQRLKNYYGDDFEMDLEDVEMTRLRSYDDSANFDKMVLKFAGQPCAQFKDKTVSTSNWYTRTLSKKQIIYSAFDVVSLYCCYPNFPPPRNITYVVPDGVDPPKEIDIKQNFRTFIKTKNNGSDKSEGEIESIWNSDPNLAAEMLKIDLNALNFIVQKSIRVAPSHKFVCKLCHKSDKYDFFKNIIKHCMNRHSELIDRSGNQNINFKELFLTYLFNTGRVILANSKCLLCNTSLNSNSELCDHCWNNHFNVLNEFIYKNDYKNKNNKKSKNNDSKKDRQKKAKKNNDATKRNINVDEISNLEPNVSKNKHMKLVIIIIIITMIIIFFYSFTNNKK